MDKITPYLKSLAALVGSVATALLGIYGPDTDMGRILTVAAAVATAVTTWAVPNKDPRGTHQDESVQPPNHEPLQMPRNEAGESALTVALVILVVVVILVVLFGNR